MLLNYHIGCIVLGLLCVGVRVRFGWGGIRAAGCRQVTSSWFLILQLLQVARSNKHQMP